MAHLIGRGRLRHAASLLASLAGAITLAGPAAYAQATDHAIDH